MAELRKIILIPLVFALGFIFIILLQTQPRMDGPRVAQGTVAPDFALKDLEGKELRLSDFRGKVVFVNFWATWCPPCKDEMPSMEKLYQSLKDRPFEMLAVSIDHGPNAVKQYRDEMKYSFPILMDLDQRVSRIYQTTGVPETFLIGPDGTILQKVIGPYDWAMPANMAVIQQMLPDSSVQSH